MAAVRGAAEFAVLRAREMAGARVRSARRSCVECLAGLEGVPNHQLVAVLGREKLSRFGNVNLGPAVDAALEGFVLTCNRVGYRPSNAMLQDLARYMAAALHIEDPPPVPDEVLRRAA